MVRSCCHFSTGKSSRGARNCMPALLTRMSIGPSASTAATPAAAASGSVTSKGARRDPVARGATRRIGGGGELGPVPTIEDHLRAMRREPLGQREADPLARAGDERPAAGEVEERECHGGRCSVDRAAFERVDEGAVPAAFLHGGDGLLLLLPVGDGLGDQVLGLLGREGEQAVLVADDDVARDRRSCRRRRPGR